MLSASSTLCLHSAPESGTVPAGIPAAGTQHSPTNPGIRVVERLASMTSFLRKQKYNAVGQAEDGIEQGTPFAIDEAEDVDMSM